MKGYGSFNLTDRLRASLKYNVVNGDEFERGIFVSQVGEAILEIERLRKENTDLTMRLGMVLPTLEELRRDSVPVENIEDML